METHYSPSARIAQILAVLEYIVRSGKCTKADLNSVRNEATNEVARKLQIDRTTVDSKYTTQLGNLSTEDFNDLVYHWIINRDQSLREKLEDFVSSSRPDTDLQAIAGFFEAHAAARTSQHKDAQEIRHGAQERGHRLSDGPEQQGRAPALTAPQPIGQPYIPEDEGATSAARQPFDVDPDHIDRGVQGHKRTQNAMARYIESLGLVPLSAGASDPLFDLAWMRDDQLYVAEVKSLTSENEERQLRLGLGQVLRYRHLLEQKGWTVVPVLVVEREPTDPSWPTLCSSLGVSLLWFERIPAAR